MQFNQPDTLIPNPYNVLDWNRYAYARFNPLRYTDPTGHVSTDDCGPDGIYCQNNSTIHWTKKTSTEISKKDKALAEQAFLHAKEDPDYFLNLYFNTDGSLWNSGEVAYLDLYLEYSDLRMTAEEYVLAGMDIIAARTARLFYTSGDTEMGNEHLLDAIAPLAAVVPLGLGSTGRINPLNLKEQLAMEEVIANPNGRPVPGFKMTDPRWPGSRGWMKMYQNVNGVHIHYNYNPQLGAYDDFKFK